MHFPIKLDFLNKVLENDGSEGLDYSYIPPYISWENITSFLLSSLGWTPDLLPNTSVLQEPRYQIQSKVFLGFNILFGLLWRI